MNILIVDDDPVSLAVLEKILTGQPGVQVTSAKDGTSAWNLLFDPARTFDVVFLDLSMPAPDGFELLRRIREVPMLKALEVILCTGSNDRATVIKCAQLGARHYIVKPCKEEIVVAKLKQLQTA